MKYYKDWWRVSVYETLNAPGMPVSFDGFVYVGTECSYCRLMGGRRTNLNFSSKTFSRSLAR